MKPDEVPKPPLLVLLTSHWLSMAGVTLVTLAGISWLFVLPANVRGHVQNPYIGLLLFVALPALFFVGLALIPIGIWLSRRSVSAGFTTIEDRRIAWRRVAMFFGVMTAVNLVIGSQLSYRAVEHLESNQFCGQSCHVMTPEFTAHQLAPHQAVECASCHVAPGATGWLHAKMGGTRQLWNVTFNAFPRPIESGLESGRLVASVDTCEQCHAREKQIGNRLRVLSKFKDDETNSRTETVLMMQVGGGKSGGIHGAHMGPGVQIRYAAADKKRQSIPWVEYRNITSGATRTYLSADAKPAAISSLPTFVMQCVDCHNRAAHSFELPDKAVDEAMARGDIPSSLPFVKKTSLDLLKANYASDAQAAERIPAGFAAHYKNNEAAGQALLAIYRHNVFPDLKVTWGTYANNLGHTDTLGCFRCHDDGHATADKKTITQDCNACHQALAVEEASPEILKTLGMAKK
jgi:NapC/NirT cytochrome c family, N-terminal region